MKSILSIMLLILSSAAIANPPVSEYKVRVFKNTTEKLWCMNCGVPKKEDKYVNVSINKRNERVEVETININEVGEETAKELGYDGSVEANFVVVKNGEVISKNHLVSDNKSSSFSSIVERVLNRLLGTNTRTEKRHHIKSLWELKTSGEFNY